MIVRFSSEDGSYNNVIKLSGNMPSSPVNLDKLSIARGTQLADEQFYLPKEVQMMIGADL
jgi:hypothetical protein